MRYFIGLGLLLAAAAVGGAQDMPLSQVLKDGETWRQVGKDLDHLWGLASDRDGNVYVTDPGGSGVTKLTTDGQTLRLVEQEKGLAAIATGPDGKVYASQPERKRILVIQGDTATPLGCELAARSLVVTGKGTLYALSGDDKVHLVNLADGRSRVVAEKLGFPTSLGLWPDQGTLVVGDSEGAHLWALRVEADGGLTARDRYYAPVRERPSDPAFPVALTADQAGRFYAATTQGVQVFDPTGRPSGVMSKPVRERVTGVAFGDKDGDALYIICGGKLYARKTLVKGVR